MSGWRGYAAVGAGSALGSALRHGVSHVAQTLPAAGFPWGTLAVNLLGSWLIAVFAASIACRRGGPLRRWQPFLMAGFCGGFTTFSLFGLETLQLAESGRTGLALGYALANVPLWLLAAWLGSRLGRHQGGIPAGRQG
ncbi:CrcB family protein [Billgrantia pellis]|uniref:Fluoride-specific ion channel FluC n=1 Tax=Billgrantia pellis TaxID=2606936 RepID=A0A7V7KH87_9GAMM|nr:CrcB family protein [Halomonas pellis]KAA0010866.1 CrcB family protein [Halomonas pellis]